MRQEYGKRSGTRWTKTAGAILLAGALIATACGGDDDGEQSTAPAVTASVAGPSTTTEEPRRGGTFTWVTHVDSVRGSFDPLTGTNTADAFQGRAIFDYLFYEDPKTGELVSGTAESLTSTDATTWTLKLRPGITFTDGTPYDAEAVKFNWDRIRDPANRSPSLSAAAGISTLEVVDPLTLRIALKSPNSQFPRTVAARLWPIGSPAFYKSITPASPPVTSPVGAGPYVVDSYTAGSRLVLRRNPSYWDAPRPYFDEVIVNFVTDTAQRYNAYSTGQAQGGTVGAGAYPQLAQAKAAGLAVLTLQYPIGGALMVLNNARPPFDDVRARQALKRALDLKAATDTVNLGLNPAPTALFEEGSAFHVAGATFPEFDKLEAQRLFDQLAAEGKPLKFTLTVSESYRPMAELYQAQLSQYRNVDVGIEVIATTNFTPNAVQGNFDVQMGFSASGADPEPDLYEQFHSQGARNYWKYANPAVDAALEAGRRSLDMESRKTAYRTVQENLIRDMPVIFMDHRVENYYLDERVRGVVTSTSIQAAPILKYMWLADS